MIVQTLQRYHTSLASHIWTLQFAVDLTAEVFKRLNILRHYNNSLDIEINKFIIIMVD